MTPEEIANYIDSHGISATVVDGVIHTYNSYYDQNRVFHREPITLPANFQTVREWLGY